MAPPSVESSSSIPDIQISTLSDEESTSSQAVSHAMSSHLDIKASRYSDIQISTIPDRASSPTIEVKQTTLRLEKVVSDELQAVCHQEQICREVLIEAMFLELLNAPELRKRIVNRATERQRKRTAVANHKRAVSMMQKVSNY